nr:chemotaxis protein CheB [Bacilli bacterium]
MNLRIGLLLEDTVLQHILIRVLRFMQGITIISYDQRPDLLILTDAYLSKGLLEKIPLIVIAHGIDHSLQAFTRQGRWIMPLPFPEVESVHSVREFIASIQSSITAFFEQSTLGIQPSTLDTIPRRIDLIALGASTGGTEALYQVLRELPTDIPGIVIVQHIPPVFSGLFANRIDEQTAFAAKEAETGDIVESGHVYVAPGDKHLRVIKLADRYRLDCSTGDRINGHCPSVDVLFDSVAKAVGRSALGVIFTGMGYDGAKGLLHMRQQGASTLGQDEASSVVYGMPKIAFEIGAVQKQVALPNLAQEITTIIRNR